MSDEPTTAYRRVRTMEGWEPLDDLSAEMTPCEPDGRGKLYSWVVYNHARREYVSGAPWSRAANVEDESNPPAARWLRELRDRLWTSKDTGYQVLDVVIHYALMDGAENEHSPGALSRDLQELRAEVVQLHQEVEFWTKGATTWRERALEHWPATTNHDSASRELVERVARWAHAEARSRTSTVPAWEDASPHVREQWLSQARAAIEGKR